MKRREFCRLFYLEDRCISKVKVLRCVHLFPMLFLKSDADNLEADVYPRWNWAGGKLALCRATHEPNAVIPRIRAHDDRRSIDPVQQR